MGATLSKPLSEVTSAELAALMERRLGPKYSTYAASLRNNAVDGELLELLEDDAAFEETLEDLDISNRLHARILKKEWKNLKERSKQNRQKEKSAEASAAPGNNNNEEDDSGSTDVCSFRSAAPRGMQIMRKSLLKNFPQLKQDDRWLGNIPPLTQELFAAVSSYEISESTDPSELEGFDRIAEKALASCHAKFSGVHLLDFEGHLVLGAKVRNDSDEKLVKDKLPVPKEFSRCYHALLADDRDFIVDDIVPGTGLFFSKSSNGAGGTGGGTYIGHVAKSREGQRVGIVCAVLDGMPEQTVDETKRDILRLLAAEAEQQLETRRVLLERTKSLKKQIAAAAAAGGQQHPTKRSSPLLAL